MVIFMQNTFNFMQIRSVSRAKKRAVECGKERIEKEKRGVEKKGGNRVAFFGKKR